MGEAETLAPGILHQIQSLVLDNLQVVSFKWLSRNFSVSSNTAKRLLQEFVDSHGDGLEVVYALSGWLKDDPSVYHVKLVSRPMLAVAREEFAESCSVHVFSVQTCIPKDPAAIWNSEFLQAEGLFNQQSELRNCLRDNRFGGVSNPFVKRDGDVASSDAAFHTHSVNRSGGSLLANSSKLEKASEPLGKFQTTCKSEISDVKNFKNGSTGSRASVQATKMSEDKEKVTSSSDHKNMGQDGNVSKHGGSLTSMWGRASVKRKSGDTSEENRTAPSSSVSADAQICAQEAAELSSDDEGRNADIKRTSHGNGRRKRQVVFDDSDEEDEHLDAVNLTSPDVPKARSFLASKGSGVALKNEESKLDLKEQDEMKLQVEKKELYDVNSKQAFGKDISCVRGMESGASSSGRGNSLSASDSDFNNKVSDPAPSSPTRRKVLRTRIDERGREVTEVVWEGEEVTTKKKSAIEDKPVGNGVADVASRPPPTKKSPAVVPSGGVNPAGKAGSKKAGNKDPKQGNIMSFFKRA